MFHSFIQKILTKHLLHGRQSLVMQVLRKETHLYWLCFNFYLPKMWYGLQFKGQPTFYFCKCMEVEPLTVFLESIFHSQNCSRKGKDTCGDDHETYNSWVVTCEFGFGTLLCITCTAWGKSLTLSLCFIFFSTNREIK